MTSLLEFITPYLESASRSSHPFALPPGWTGPFDFARYYYDASVDLIMEHEWCRVTSEAVTAWNTERYRYFSDENDGGGQGSSTPSPPDAPQPQPFLFPPPPSNGTRDGRPAVQLRPAQARSRSRSPSRGAEREVGSSLRSRSPLAQRAESPPPRQKRARGTQWTDAETALCCDIYVRVAYSGLFCGEARFAETARQMCELGHMRTKCAVKSQWNRVGRDRTGFDERRKKTAVLATSLQGKRKRTRMGDGEGS